MVNVPPNKVAVGPFLEIAAPKAAALTFLFPDRIQRLNSCVFFLLDRYKDGRLF